MRDVRCFEFSREKSMQEMVSRVVGIKEEARNIVQFKSVNQSFENDLFSSRLVYTKPSAYGIGYRTVIANLQMATHVRMSLTKC